LCVNEEGSFTAAARRLNVSVVAIQKLVTLLERQLGVRLFERSTRGLTLTNFRAGTVAGDTRIIR
jgi:DNA-binding transcriptional LysR family regulator